MAISAQVTVFRHGLVRHLDLAADEEEMLALLGALAAAATALEGTDDGRVLADLATELGVAGGFLEPPQR